MQTPYEHASLSLCSLLVIVIVGGVDPVEDPVRPGGPPLPVKHVPAAHPVLEGGRKCGQPLFQLAEGLSALADRT